MLNNELADIELSMDLSPDVDPVLVKRLYNEANIAFPDAIMKRLEDVNRFYRAAAGKIGFTGLKSKEALPKNASTKSRATRVNGKARSTRFLNI